MLSQGDQGRGREAAALPGGKTQMQPLLGMNPSCGVMLQAKRGWESTELGWGSAHRPLPRTGSITGDRAPCFPLCLLPSLATEGGITK